MSHIVEVYYRYLFEKNNRGENFLGWKSSWDGPHVSYSWARGWSVPSNHLLCTSFKTDWITNVSEGFWNQYSPHTVLLCNILLTLSHTTGQFPQPKNIIFSYSRSPASKQGSFVEKQSSPPGLEVQLQRGGVASFISVDAYWHVQTLMVEKLKNLGTKQLFRFPQQIEYRPS